MTYIRLVYRDIHHIMDDNQIQGGEHNLWH